jgi:hypothetical protein
MKNVGMDSDELLRLKQISGLASLFAGREFSKSWTSDAAAPDLEPMEFEDGEERDAAVIDNFF